MIQIYKYAILALALALVGVSFGYYQEHRRADLGERYRETLMQTRAQLVKVDAQGYYYKAKWEALKRDIAQAKKSGRLLPGPMAKSSRKRRAL